MHARGRAHEFIASEVGLGVGFAGVIDGRSCVGDRWGDPLGVLSGILWGSKPQKQEIETFPNLYQSFSQCAGPRWPSQGGGGPMGQPEQSLTG
jgi:hypothetical protein